MPDAHARGWGDPTAKGYKAEHIIAVQAAGRTLNVRREVAHLFMGFLQELVYRGYPINVGPVDDWGWICRPIRGYEKQWAATHDFKYLSEHSWGLAIDINTRTNPMTNDGKVHTDMPAWVGDVAAKWGLRWGANYTGKRKDPQHFEFVGTPADVAKYPLRDPAPAPQPAPRPIEEDDVLFTYRDGRDNRVWIVERGQRRHVERPELDAYKAAGVLDEPKVLTADQADVMAFNYPEKK